MRQESGSSARASSTNSPAGKSTLYAIPRYRESWANQAGFDREESLEVQRVEKSKRLNVEAPFPLTLPTFPSARQFELLTIRPS